MEGTSVLEKNPLNRPSFDLAIGIFELDAEADRCSFVLEVRLDEAVGLDGIWLVTIDCNEVRWADAAV